MKLTKKAIHKLESILVSQNSIPTSVYISDTDPLMDKIFPFDEWKPFFAILPKRLKNGDIVFMQRIMMREKPLFRPFSQKFLEEKGIGSKVEYMSIEDYKLTNIGK